MNAIPNKHNSRRNESPKGDQVYQFHSSSTFCALTFFPTLDVTDEEEGLFTTLGVLAKSSSGSGFPGVEINAGGGLDLAFVRPDDGICEFDENGEEPGEPGEVNA